MSMGYSEHLRGWYGTKYIIGMDYTNTASCYLQNKIYVLLVVTCVSTHSILRDLGY